MRNENESNTMILSMGGNGALETIPEETDLPRIQKLIPKSPETRKREQEYQRLCEKYSNDKSIEQFYELLVMSSNINRICFSDNYFANRKNCNSRICNKSDLLIQTENLIESSK